MAVFLAYAIIVSCFICAILIGITVHEAAHAWMANKLGDPTAKYEGRISLNPVRHLDPVGTVMIVLSSLSGYGFGWGKPVPYNPYHLKNHRTDAVWIALAGPAANLITALICSLILKLFITTHPALFAGEVTGDFLYTFIDWTIDINLSLMIFNLLPIPPLDGSKILALIWPPERHPEIRTFFQYGPVILIGLILFDDIFNIHLFEGIFIPIRDAIKMLIQFST